MRQHSVSCLAIAMAVGMVPTHALAQQSEVDEQGVDSSANEILVTANKKAENLQDTSVSVAVLSSAAISEAGVAQATDLSAMTPGLQISMGGPAPQVYIRGVGDFSTNAGNESAVSMNIDGIYASRTHSIGASFYDLERIEVLKGPQGTLYGRNASGGAVNIIPVKPRLGEFSGNLSAGVQNYSGLSAEGALNIPIGDKVAIRLAGQVVNRDGYLSDGTNDDVHQSARLQVLLEPTSDLTLRLWGSYAHIGGKGPGYALYEPHGSSLGAPVVPGDAWTPITDQYNANISLLNPPPPAAPFFGLLGQQKPYQNIDLWDVHAQLDWDVGQLGTLTIIPAYQHARLEYHTEPTLSYTSIGIDGKPWTSRTASVEARVTGGSGPAEWVVGGYYFNEKQNYGTEVDFGFVNHIFQEVKYNTLSYAAFGQLTFSLSDSLRLIGGLRYSKDDKDFYDAVEYSAFPSLNCVVPGTGPGGACVNYAIPLKNYSDSTVNYKAGVEYDITPDNLLYANVSTGFKAGGQSIAQVPLYKPEKVTNYVIGTKNEFANGVITLNAEFFYLDYKDHQESLITIVGTSASEITLNAGSGSSKGVSVDLGLRPTSNDNIGISVEYLDAHYSNFSYEQFSAFVLPGVSTTCATSASTVNPGYTVLDCAGKQLTRAPTWSGSVRYSHTFDLADDSTLEFSASGSGASSRWLHASFTANSRAPSYFLTNASLTYRTADKRFSVQGFVRNLTNTKVYSGGEQASFDPGFFGAIIGPPRTYGLRASFDF